MNVVRQVTYTALILATIGIGMGYQRSGPIPSSAPEGDRAWSKHWAYEQQRSRAHRRMKSTMYASTADRADVTVMCPALSDGRLGPPITLDGRGVFRTFDTGRYSAKSDEVESESALDFFLNNISGPIVQAKCINCHVEGGVSGHTRLVFQPSSNPDHGTLNLATIRNLLSSVEDGAELILNKIQGVGHGGGVQVAAGTADFANMERLLELLGYGDGSGSDLTPETLFDTVTMSSPGKTLRRAALIFGGRVPTREEREAVDNGTEEDLRKAIRERMTGRGFHEFLIRASNDRLLTDRDTNGVLETDEGFVDFTNLFYTKLKMSHEKGLRSWEDPEWDRWIAGVVQGAMRAPLELIAHVVENDLPYTEILTADYIMANPMAAEAYGASTRFEDEEDPLEFRQSEIVSYYRDDDSKVVEKHPDFGPRVINPGNLSTEYPHAGILNTTVFLKRYPTTATNRNRARSRWTYYHFLGLDIEKSASRTTDPVALADTDNPTMKNPACTVCHRIMDPVAGTFQNYGEEAGYRDEWGGLDSLDYFYKNPPDGSYTPYQYGDTWYRDMREPGFDGEVAPDADNSLQWLAERIVADARFAEATVKFWWPAILGVEVAEPPEDRNDSDFEALLLASNAQSAEVERLADSFRTGIAGGKAYNLKDLLVEIVLSPWFRAESIEDDDPVRAVALRNAGVERLLTPEELAWKTQTITGFGWRRKPRPVDYISALSDPYPEPYTKGDREYGLTYGGIDSDSATDRADDMTAVMAAVAQSHAVEVSCPIVRRDFRLLPDERRWLFAGIDEHVTPISDFDGIAVIEADSWKKRQTVSLSGFLYAGNKNVRLEFLNAYYDRETEDDRELILDQIIVRNHAGKVVERIELENLDQSEGCKRPWLNESTRRESGYILWCSGTALDVPVSFPTDGEYRIDVVAFQLPAGDEAAMLKIEVESDKETSLGAMAIRNKLVELHERLLGVAVTADSPDVEAAYQLFVEVWEREREYRRNEYDPEEEESECEYDDCWYACDVSDKRFYEGIADDVYFYNESGYLDYDWDLLRKNYLDEVDWYSERPESRAWVAVLTYLLMDYRYLYL